MMTDSQGQINTFRHLNTKKIKVPQSSHVIQKKKKKKHQSVKNFFFERPKTYMPDKI